MVHFKTRNQLLEWLEEHAPLRMIRRAVVEGEVELYGFFEDSAFMPAGWIVRIKSRFGKEWLVCIYCDPYIHGYRAITIHAVIWNYWKGGGSELFNGDHPARYRKLKEEWE